MEASYETSIIASILVNISSLNTFELLLNLISCSLISYWALFRCLLLFAANSKPQFEPKKPSSKEQGRKLGTRLDEDINHGWFLLGKDVSMIMKRLGIEQHGFLERNAMQKRWGCNEISGLFEEEEVRVEELREAFAVFDQDKDGFIDASELQRVLLALGFNQAQELKACTHMIRAFDYDGDDKIDFHEFVKLLHLDQ